MFSIVLYQPEIPGNTGNIGRLCVNIGAKLHLIKPLGFDISEKSIKRAGLDYWKFLDYHVWENFEEFKNNILENNETRVFYFSTKAKKILWENEFKNGDYLVFGPETRGLPESLISENINDTFKIPMPSKNARSFNLANSVAIVAFEGMRQIKFS